MSRALLHINQLKEFRQWVESLRIPIRDGSSQEELVQVLCNGKWLAIYRQPYRKESPNHVTVSPGLVSLVRSFLSHRKKQLMKPSNRAELSANDQFRCGDVRAIALAEKLRIPTSLMVKELLQCPGAERCRHCTEVPSLRMDGERYQCNRCGDSYFIDYEEIK